MIGFIITPATIVLCVLMVAFAVLGILTDPFARLRKGVRSDSSAGDGLSAAETADLPEISIVLTPHDEVDALRRNLPLLLNQYYPRPYRVIVVAEEGDHETEDALKQIQHDVSAPDAAFRGVLYVTRTPSSHRYVSRKKLAITLGVKAAESEWVALVEASARPASERWLASMCQATMSGATLIAGYVNYDDGTSAFKRFWRLLRTAFLMLGYMKGTGFASLGGNVFVRKDTFLAHEGFRTNLDLERGEYDFLVNDNTAHGDRMTFVGNPEAWMTEDQPSRKSWVARRLTWVETRGRLVGAARQKARFAAGQLFLHLSFLLPVAILVVAASDWQPQTMLLAGVAAVCILATLVARGMFARRASRMFSAGVSWPSAVFFEIVVLWNGVYFALRHLLADKRDFSTHKL